MPVPADAASEADFLASLRSWRRMAATAYDKLRRGEYPRRAARARGWSESSSSETPNAGVQLTVRQTNGNKIRLDLGV